MYVLFIRASHLDTANDGDLSNVVVSGLAAQKFGLASLHHWQMKIIEATIMHKDTLVVQPTGTGKSICYMIPPLHDGKTAVVITPTISLMLDQVSGAEIVILAKY
jgi:ATP-dependent DNA helicase RecQ